MNDFADYYYCWSRQDEEENSIKNLIIETGYQVDNELTEQLKQSFSTRYHFNGTHYKCATTSEEWADIWFTVNESGLSPCLSDTKIPVNVLYRNTTNKL